MKLVELKEELRKRHLKLSGKKQQLIARWVVWSLVSVLCGIRYIEV